MDSQKEKADINTMTFHARPASGIAFFLSSIFFFLMTAGNLHADETNSQAVNWAYQSSLGDGAFIGKTENAQIYNLPLSYTLKNINEAGWALKFRLPLTVGIYNIEAPGRDIDVDVMSAVPGIELQMPVRDNWLLAPFAGFGAGKDASGGGERYLYSLGIKHYVYSRREAFEFTFGNTLRRDGFSARGGGRDGSITSLSAGLDIRFPMGFNLPKSPGYMSLYGVFRHYFDGGIALYMEEMDFKVNDQVESGITLSSVPNWKIWRMTIERLGIGYCSGGKISSIRVFFGMPF